MPEHAGTEPEAMAKEAAEFRFVCPHCGHESLVGLEQAGQEGPCAGCGRPVRIPDPRGQGVEVVVPDRVPWAWSVLGLGAVVLLGLCLIGGWLQWGSWLQQRWARQEAADCEKNLQRLLAALAAYEQEHGRLPPAWTTDEQGRRLHSWRVLILPYLGYDYLYEEIRLEEPWDSPHNRQFHDRMPAEFSCPTRAGDAGQTSYLVVVGPRMAFTGAKGRRLDELTDPAQVTVLLVESANKQVPWMKPEELDEQELDFFVNSGTAVGISSYHPRGAHVATLSGHVLFLSDQTDPAMVRQMLTVDDGQPPAPPP